MIIRKSPREIEKMALAARSSPRRSRTSARCFAPGVTTGELDDAAGAFIREHGGIPTSEGYKGYPRAICISPNDVVVHGIPGRVRGRRGRPRHDRRRDHARRLHRGQRVHVRRRRHRARGAAPPRRRPGRARGRDRARRGRQPRRRHLARGADGRRGAPTSRSSAASSATASAATTTRIRTSRTSASPGAGRGSPRA